MKNYQRTLELTDEDIARIEQPILAQEEAKYQEKLKEEKSKRQRQQEAEKAKQLELQKQREVEKQEEKLRQQEQDYQQKLQQYEQKVSNSITQGISPSHIRQELRQLQQTLGLKDSDVSSIETKLISRQSSASNIPSQPQPRQAGFLSSKKARRSVLLGITALGLVLMFSQAFPLSLSPFFLLENFFLLVGGICVWRASKTQGIAVWRLKIIRWGGVVGFVWLVVVVMVMMTIGADFGECDKLINYYSIYSSHPKYKECVFLLSLVNNIRWTYSGGIIIYLTSIYIGRW